MARNPGIRNKPTNKGGPSKGNMIQLAANDVVAISEADHAKLLVHVQDRLKFGNSDRETLIERYKLIAREIAGYVKLDEEDTQRELDNQAGRGPKVTDFSLPLVLTQMDELVTYLLEVLVPEEGMYKAIAPKNFQDAADGFSRILNQQAEDFNHYTNYSQGLLNALFYNIGAWETHWEEVHGNTFTNGTGGNFEIEKKVVNAGNVVGNIDVYNFLYDQSVPVEKLSSDGEFYATVDIKSSFRLEKESAEEKIFSIDRIPTTATTPTLKYYKERANLFNNVTSGGVNLGINWIGVLSAGQSGGDEEILKGAYEEVKITMWIRPKTFGLSESTDLEVWRFVLINDEYFVKAEFLNNAHGMLPVAVAQPWPETSTSREKSPAEYLIPIQRFSSFLMNVHQRANRKSLWGISVYDKDAMDIGTDTNFTGGAIPASLGRTERDVRKVFAHFTDGPDTSRTMQDVDHNIELLQYLMPTDMAKQVANLERATQYQAAATVQAAKRRHKKLAKILDQSAFVHIRTQLMFNTFQFQQVITIFDDSGKSTTIDPATFRETGDVNIRFAISDGLQGIDKLLIMELWKDIGQWVLQSSQAQEQLDIVAILDYITSIAGDKFDLSQFKFSHELDGQPNEVKDAAMAALQQLTAAQEQGQAGGPVNGGGPPGALPPTA